MSKTVIFQTVQFSYIQLINRTLSGTTTLGQSGPGNDGNKEVLRISQSYTITRASPSDCLVPYPGHSLGKSYPSAEMQSMYSAAPADWATDTLDSKRYYQSRTKWTWEKWK